MKQKIFKHEIELIQNKQIKDLVREILNRAPKYFWDISSSLSGKHHPSDENKKGGRVLHTKRVVCLADQLCRMDGIEGIDRDKLLGAMIIHDICCCGVEDAPLDHVPPEHVIFVREITEDLKGCIYYEELMEIVEGHFGRWGPKQYKYKTKENRLARLGHIADYIASRKNIVINITTK